MNYPHDHENEVNYFARTNYRNALTKFGIKTDDRRRHVYIIGKTGMGKTTLMENMILADIYAGHGCCYVDPHGDTAERLIDYIPSWRINDVVYMNPADVDFPIGFNILEATDDRHKHLVASGMMGVFKKIWENVWSARMEYILNNTILALLDNPGSTLLGINRMLSDAEYRKRIVSNVKDPIVKQFWVVEFASYQDKYAQEAVAPIQNKVGQFLSAAIIRNIVAQVKSTIDIRQIMDEEKIFIVNLSKGRIGEDSSRLLGGMLITKIQLAAMERVDIPEVDRRDFYLYVDEFQNFAVESFAGILSEARKYRLCLVMAHQYITQLSEEVRDAVFGNVGTIIAYRVGAPDAEFMETEFTPRFEINDIINLPKYNIYIKLLIDGVTSAPFSATTLPPIAQRTGSIDRVIRVTRERYATPREEIATKIMKWSGMGEEADIDLMLKEAEEKKKTMKKSRKPMFDYNCTRCNKAMSLPVELDRSRPIYCEDCIEIVREERAAGRGKKVERKAPDIAAALPNLSDGAIVEKGMEQPSISLSAIVPKPKPPAPSPVPVPKPPAPTPAPAPVPKPPAPTPTPVSLPMPKPLVLSPVTAPKPSVPSSVTNVSTPAPSKLPPPLTPPRAGGEAQRKMPVHLSKGDDRGLPGEGEKRKHKRKRKPDTFGSTPSQSPTPRPPTSASPPRPPVPQAPAPRPIPPKTPPPASPPPQNTSGTLHAGESIMFE